MLEGIDSVAWSALKHAYGPAVDVPEQIRALASPNASEREKALWQLYGNIFHQGTRYEATPHAVPFLYELLQEPAVRDKHEIIGLLVSIAIGYDEAYLPDGFDPNEFRLQIEREEIILSDESQPEHNDFGVSPAAILDCYETVLSGTDVLIELLESKNTPTRVAAAFALAWFPEVSTKSLPRLRELIEQSSDVVEKATAIIACGLISKNMPIEAELEFLEDYLADKQSPVVRAAAAMSLARDPLRSDLTDTLIEVLQTAPPECREENRLSFNEGKFLGYISLVLAKYGQTQRGRIVQGLSEILKEVNAYESLDVSIAMLNLIADKQGRSLQEVGFENLNDTQRLALNSIADYGGWSERGGFANYDLLMSDYGLPTSQSAMYLFLGRTVDSITFSKSSASRPVTPWWKFW